MENVRIIKLFLGGLILSTLVPQALAYQPNTAHRALTQEIVAFFEEFYPEYAFTTPEREAILRGSAEEDEGSRPLRHFYDGAYGVGLFSTYAPSIEWAEDTKAQAGMLEGRAVAGVVQPLFSADSDYSWDRAVYDYAHGDRLRGLEALGHILHLIEDKTVPDHTRNDSHPPYFDDIFEQESPYEYWTDQFTTENIRTAEKLQREGKEPVVLSTLSDYFDALAKYSNRNFFSKDTILTYPAPTIFYYGVEDSKKFGYREVGGVKFRLVLEKENFDRKKQDFEKTLTIEDNLIMSDYWDLLSKQAVVHGAGVIKLFFDRVEEERQTLALYEKNKSVARRATEKTTGLAKAGAESMVRGARTVGNAATSGYTNTINFFKGLWGSVDDADVVAGPVVASNPSALSAGAFDESAEEPRGEAGEQDTGLTTGAPAASNEPAAQNTPGVAPERIGGPNLTALFALLAKAQADVAAIEEGVSRHTQETRARGPAQETEPPPSAQTQSRPDPFRTPIAPLGFGAGGGPDIIVSASEEASEENENADTGASREGERADDQGAPPDEAESAPIHLFVERAAFGITATSSEITVTGTSTPGAVVTEARSGGEAEADDLGDWSLPIALADGDHTLSFTAALEQATSAPILLEAHIDTTPPAISFETSDCPLIARAESSICTIATTTQELVWQSANEDFSHIEIRIGGLRIATTTESISLTLPEHIESRLFIRAYDTLGNAREYTALFDHIAHPVVINEIGWAGTGASSADEWIELFNNTREEIDLEGWVLAAEDGTPYIPLSGTIAPRGYYLIERSDDDTVRDISADFMTPFSGMQGGAGLSNGGEMLVLFDAASTTIDRTPDTPTWAAGDASARRSSMERISARGPGDDALNWHTAIAELVIGEDANGGGINGTPRAKNSSSFLINGGRPIAGEVTLTKEGSPYLGHKTRVLPEGVLRIEPGAQVAFICCGMDVSGALVVEGTAEDPVLLAPYNHKDMFFRDERNRRGTGGEILGVVVASEGGVVDITHAHIERIRGINAFGGTISIAHSSYTDSTEGIAVFRGSTLSVQDIVMDRVHERFDNISIFQSNAVIDGAHITGATGNSCIAHFANFGPWTLTVKNSSCTGGSTRDGIDMFDGTAFFENNTIAGVESLGLGIFDSTVSLVGNTTHDNRVGIELVGSVADLSKNEAYENRTAGVEAFGSEVLWSENHIHGNAVGVWIIGTGILGEGNVIEGNTDFGAFNQSGEADMAGNYWGHPTGPFHADLNPGGEGNAVSDGVLFDPFLERAPGDAGAAAKPPRAIRFGAF